MKKFSIYFFLILFLNTALGADTLSLSFFQNMTDNLFQNRYSEPDQISSFNFYIDKNISGFSFFTEGNYSYLHKNPKLAYYLHDIGIDYLRPVNEKTAFYFSLIGQGAFYRSDYEDFNYFSFNFLAAIKTYISQTSILKSNYILEYKKYKYSLFDFVSHSVFLSFDKFFQTKTTLKSEISWGYKNFLHPYSSEEVIPEDYTEDHHSGRRTYIFVPKIEYEEQGIQIFSIKGLIAQGVGDRIGLRISGMKQWILSGGNPFSSVEEFYMVENPSYDSYSWTGYQLSSQLTVLVPWDIELKIGYTMDNKEFHGIESMSLEGDTLGITRKDERGQFEARLEKNFPIFSVFLSYFYIDNQSNDPFFDWQSNLFSVGIELNTFINKKK